MLEEKLTGRKSRRRAQGLVNDAETLAHLDETLHRRGIGVGVQFEGQCDISEADRRFARSAPSAMAMVGFQVAISGRSCRNSAIWRGTPAAIRLRSKSPPSRSAKMLIV